MPSVSRARIHVQPVTPALAAAVRALRLTPEQHAYVGEPAFNLADAQGDACSEAMAVLAGARVIGFYRLDFSNAVTGRPPPAPSVGLRAFLLDVEAQGHGDGSRAVRALCADLRARHPRRRLLVLAVACRNLRAIAAYRRAGFVATGELLPGGHAGPQQLMLRALDDADVGH